MDSRNAGVVGTYFIGPAGIEVLRRLGSVHVIALAERTENVARAKVELHGVEIYYVDRARICRILDALVERAARLTAITLACVVLKSGRGLGPCFPVCIAAEGTTFYKLESLRGRAECYLQGYLRERHERYYKIAQVENAALIGAATAGLTN